MAAPLSRRELLTVATAAGFQGCATRARSGQIHASPRSVVVLGAGLSGLVSAMELVARGFEVQVLEAQSQPGGRIRTVRSPFPEGLYAEAGATHVVGDPDLLALCSELKVELVQPKKPRWPKRVVYRRGARSVVAANAELPSDEPPLRPDEEALGFEGQLE